MDIYDQNTSAIYKILPKNEEKQFVTKPGMVMDTFNHSRLPGSHGEFQDNQGLSVEHSFLKVS